MEEIKNKSSAMQKYFQDLEKDIILIITERLDKIANTRSDDLENLLNLQSISDDLRTIRKKIAEMIDKGKVEMYNIIESYAREYYDKAAENHEKPPAPFGRNQKILRLVEQTKRESCEKFAQSLKIETLGLENTEGEFKFLEQAYREIVNKAVAKVMRKDEDVENFIETALENLLEKGLVKYGN